MQWFNCVQLCGTLQPYGLCRYCFALSDYVTQSDAGTCHKKGGFCALLSGSCARANSCDQRRFFKNYTIRRIGGKIFALVPRRVCEARFVALDPAGHGPFYVGCVGYLSLRSGSGVCRAGCSLLIGRAVCPEFFPIQIRSRGARPVQGTRRNQPIEAAGSFGGAAVVGGVG